MPSFWENESFVHYDYLIIGGGIVGLSTAIELRLKAPNARIGVLERGVFPSGASTKNAGFACFGSLTEVLSDLEKLSPEEVMTLVERRWSGLRLLRERLGDERIDFHNYGGYELLQTPVQLAALNKLEEINELLHPLFGEKVYHSIPEKIKELGFDASKVKGLVFNSFEGQIHTGKMMKALQHYAMQENIELMTGASVADFEDEGNGVTVRLQEGAVFKTKRLAICTNAFSRQLLPKTDLKPGRGMVLITKPIPGLKLKGTFHYDEGYYYFRNYENRIIFGGGRNLDIEGETTTEFGLNQLILDKLKKDLSEFILPGQLYDIEQVWSGIMAFGDTKQPLLKQHSNSVFLGVRLGGMGVAIGSLLGKELAELMTESGNN